jgi:ABC-type sugar transport system permease subunit
VVIDASKADKPAPSLKRIFGSPGADGRRAAAGVVLALIGPAIAVYLAFTLYPVMRTFWNSVHAVKANGIETWVGLKNFSDLLKTDEIFWTAVSNTATFTIGATLIDVFGGLLLALCLFAKVPLRRLLRVIWFTPVLMSYVVVGVIWVWIFDYDWGTLNTVLRWLHLDILAQSWLGDPRWALWAVMVAHIWKWLGFNMIIFLAALHSLPSEVLGAAELDNCGWLAKTVYVIVPMLRPTIVNLLVLSFIGKMMVFDLVWIMTGGGPLWSTETVSTYVYKRAFDWNTFDLGYPSAIAVVWCALILLFVIAMNRLLRQRDRLEF